MPTISHELIIAASPEKVYKAITEQQGLSAWWSPDAKAEAKLNSIASFPFGPEYHKEMKITALNPFSEVRWTCIKGAEEWTATHISFELKSGNKDTLLESRPELTDQVRQQQNLTTATVLIFHHSDWRDHTPMFAECNYTWALFLRSLKLFCETGVGSPWPDQHRTDL
jgi:uncharacterized protein YndB with AHSA1/START domain